jgi:uncharacterized RDD family membrane protein YckC
MAYAFLLFWINVNFVLGNQSGDPDWHPLFAQFIGLISLTLPIFFCFYLTEKSPKHATLGKRIVGIRLEPLASDSSFFMRNLLKFLPWEMAHTGVHWLFYYDRVGNEVPIWVWALLVVPQAITVLYWLTIVLKKGRSGFYDKLGKTRLVSDHYS